MSKRRVHNLPATKSKRKELRANLTPAEALLWTNLKNSQLGKKFRRQHGIGPFIVDFYCAEYRLAIELDGDGHMSITGAEADQSRTNFLKALHITVLRFENRDIFDNLDVVLSTIQQKLN